MTNEQQENINTIIEGYYAKGAEKQHAQWREVASFVYANALRDSETSLLELKTAFGPLQKIAASANMLENSAAVGRAITQPFTNSAAALQDGSAWAAMAATSIRLMEDPLANVKTVWNGLQATRDAAIQLVEHETGILSMQERQRLAAMYDLPHEQRIQALHGVTLKDTAAMVSVGSLPGILPNAMTKVKTMMREAVPAVVREADNFPALYGNQLPALVAGMDADSLPVSQQVLTMATKGSGNGGDPEDTKPGSGKEFDIRKYEYRDPNFDVNRYWEKELFNVRLKDFSDYMDKLGLKEENKLIKTNLDHLLNVQITQTPAEYKIVLTKTQELVHKAEIVDFNSAIASGMSPVDAMEASQAASKQFGKIQKFVQEERVRNFNDLLENQSKYELQEEARKNPDSVGYDRAVSPRSITDRELHHHLYLQDFRDKIIELKDKFELLGLKDRAESLDARMREMLVVSLEDSKAVHHQRVEDFMKIEAEAKNADIKNSSDPNISERHFKKIQEGIGVDLEHIKEEIGHDREYHIRHQLWQRQSADERRVTESAMIEKVRSELFGYSQSVATPEPGPEF